MPSEKEFENRLAADVRGMTIPQPDAAFENRILMAAFAQQTVKDAPVTVHSGNSFTAWWNAPRLAFAAALAALALVFLTSAESFSPQPTEQQIAQERYTVDGIPLLADVDVAAIEVSSDDAIDEYDLVFASF
ncbi:MAG: hypothetical protein FJX23_06125 [Alphaproteobacteria bacterium]|nr:hypothetical protein [Alphaproteobacteria bacterium]